MIERAQIELDFDHAFLMDGNHKLTHRHLKIRKDLEIKELDRNMVYDRTLCRNFIHVADLTQWDKAWSLLLYSRMFKNI